MIKVAVIGAGQMGAHHIRNYSQISGVELVAISDVREEKRELALKHGCKFYVSYNEMLRKEGIDIVSIAVPSKFHHQVAIDAINAGKHVLIEKPIAETIQQAEEMIKAAKEKNVKLMVGHVERFNPTVKRVKDIIDLGTIGDITSIIARRVGGYPRNAEEGNVITDLAVHDIDVFNYLLGKEPISVHSHSVKAQNSSRTNSAEILINYGETGCISQVNWITPTKIRTLSITGTLGHIEVNNIAQEITLYSNLNSQNLSFKSFDEFVLKFGNPTVKKIEIEKKEEPLRLEIEAFINSVLFNKEPPVTGEDGLRALKTATKALNGETS